MNPDAKKNFFVKQLFFWFRANGRTYPWREIKDPYKVLIAELMLQRTKAEQVVPVFGLFMNRFPTIDLVAAASLQEIIRLIKPLGLTYRGARLRLLARELVRKHHSVIPADKEVLLDLYGVGSYIANAVRCFAYGHSVALVDSNIARILKRVFSLKFGSAPHKEDHVWKFLQAMIRKGSAKEFNWALIDFGNIVCTPRHPKCNSCPLNSICDYYRNRS